MSIRPEEQQANSNRSGLNIQQPGESSDFDFSSVPLMAEPLRDPSLGIKDIGLAVASAPFEMAHSIGEIFKSGDNLLDLHNQELYDNRSDKSELSSAQLRASLGLDRRSLSSYAARAIGAAGDFAGDISKGIKDNYSDGAKEAAQMRFVEKDKDGNLSIGDGMFDKDAWIINAVPTIAELLIAGGAAKIGSKGAQKIAEEAAYNKLKKTLPEEIARATARETGELAAQRAGKTGFVNIMTASAQGSSGNQMRSEILELPFESLSGSSTFKAAFTEIDNNEETKGLSDSDKLAKARQITAEKAAAAVTTDPKMLAVNLAASTLGDHTLFSLLTNKGAADSVLGGIAKGSIAEGATEFAQGSSERYVQNEQLINTAGQKIDPMKDVLEVGVNNAVLGAGIGGGFGAIGGVRGRKNKENELSQDTDVEQSPATEPEINPESEYGNLDTPAYLRQDPRIQGFAEDSEVQQALSQESPQPTAEELIQQQIGQGNQGLTPEESAILEQAEQIRNRRAAQQEALDQASTPRLPAPGDTNLGQYHPLPGPVHSFADEQQAGAGNRITITGDKPGKAQPKEGVSQPPKQQEGQLEPPLNTTEQEQAPSTEGVVVSGDQTFVHGSSKADMTLDDIAITGRQTKQGKRNRDYGGFYVLDGNQSEKAEHYSKMQEGTPTLYDVKLHEGVRIYEAKTKGEVERLSAKRIAELVDQGYGAVRGYDIMGKNLETAIIDKNAIADFKPRQPSETTATSALNNEGVVASESLKVEQDVKPAKQTEVKAEPLGELKFFDQKNATPFQTQVGAKASKWGRIEGARIEPHGDGYAVRLPAPKTSVSETSNATDGKGELKLFFGRPFPSEQVAKRTIQVRERGGVVEKIEGGYGVRMPVSGDLTATNPTKNKAAEQHVPKEPSKQKVVQGPKIEDFGETLHGAAKHKWGALSSLAETQQTTNEIKTQPLSKVFPKPDYKKLAENGIETEKLAALAVLRAQIPTKPKSSHRLDAWADRTKILRDFAQEVLTGKHDLNAVRSRMKESNKTRAIDDTIELINMFPAEQMDVAANYRVTSGHYTFFNGEDLKRGATRYLLEDSKGRSFMSVNAKSLEELLPKAKEFIQQMHFTEESNTAPTSTKQAKIQIFTNRSTKNVFIGYRGATDAVKLKEGFKDTREAHNYLKEHRQELEQQLRELREDSRKEQRRDSNESRKGPERRKGNVTPEQFSDAFGFRGVQFGNYVEGARRQQDLNLAYDSLMDLSELMNIPPAAISLNGQLGLAFGARGHGNAKAHYEPGSIVINLTKNSGAGSLAHEWFHALDNYFGTADSHGYDSGRPSGEMMTTQARRDYQYVNGKREPTSYTVRPEVYQAFKNVIKSINESGLLQRSQTLDQTRSKAYWSTKVEMSARAFERYILDRAEAKNISNDFLVNLYKQDEGRVSQDRYAYPTSEELDGGVRETFDNFVKVLKTKQTDKGTALYSRQNDIKEGGLTVEEAQKIADDFQREYNGNIPIDIEVYARQEDIYGPRATQERVGRLSGAYHAGGNGRTVLSAASIRNEADGRRTLRHEILGHYGLNTFKSADKKLVIDAILKSKGDPQLREIWERVEKNYSDKSESIKAEEVFAHAAEFDRHERKVRSGRRILPASIIHAFQLALRRAGLVKGPMKVSELFNAIDAVSDGIRSGRRKQQIFPKTDQDQFRRDGHPQESASRNGGVSVSEGDLGNGNTISESGHTKSIGKPAGVKPRRIELIAQQFVRNLNGAAKIKVKVVATQAEAAAMMPGGIPKEFGTVHAIYQAELNRVILVAENMESDSFVREKLRHEIIAHHGLASVIGDAEYDRVIRVLHQSRNSTNKEIQAVWKKVEKDYGHESPEVQANEFLAHMAERKELTTLGAAWDRFVTMLTNALRKVGMMTERDITPAEIRNILHTITGRFKKTAMYDSEAPGSREFNDTFSRTDALYSATAAATNMDAEIRRKMGFNVEKGAIDKAKDFYGMVSGKDKTQLKEWTRETLRKLNIKTFDGLAQLKYVENEAGISDARVSAYVAARMSAGAGSVTAAMLEFGIAQYNKAEGIIQRKEGTGKADSLMGILDSLGNNREDFFKWIAGHRSERLMKEGKEKNFTAEEIAHMKTLNKGKEAEFAAAKVKYDAFIKSILDLQEDMGLINQESRSLWEDAWYLPYYREAENGETKGPWTSKGIANQRSTVQKLKGSELTIKDPIENLFNYVAKSVDASMKNEAMRKAVVNLADTGIVDVISNPNAMDYQRLGKDVVKVSIDGVESLVQVHDPLLYKAFTMIDMQKSNSMFMRAARQAKRVLTIGTTSMPDFIIRNFMRDALHAWTIGGKSFKPVTDSWRGLNKALKHDDSLIEMMFAGATFGGGYSNVYDPSSTASNIRKALRRKGYKDSQIREFESSIVTTSKQALNKLEAGLNKYQGWSEAGENANRIGTYDAAIKDGKSKAQAAFESRDLMDFSMMGASNIMITLSDMLPFFNARMQGLSKLGRAIKADPMGVAKRGGLITAASLALLALNWDDDRYEELPDWDKDTYWHFFMGEQHYRIPKPFEIGLMFGTLPERMVRAIGGKDSGAKFGKLVAHNFMEQLAFNPIPQVGLPIFESFVNYDFFKGGPIENSADMNLIASARYNDQTSLLAREIGDATGMSPKQIEHIVTGYTGTLGSYVLGAIDTVMRGVGNYGDTPEMRMDEAPVLKSLIRGSGPAKNTQFTEDFYKMLGEANQVHSTINSYMKKGRQEDARKLMDENRSKLAQRKALTNTQKEVKQLNAQIEMVKIDRILTSEQKRERIDRLLSLRNKITQQAVQRVNPYFDK